MLFELEANCIAMQKVMELQSSKKELAGVLLSPHESSEGDDKLGGLHVSILLYQMYQKFKGG